VIAILYGAFTVPVPVIGNKAGRRRARLRDRTQEPVAVNHQSRSEISVPDRNPLTVRPSMPFQCVRGAKDGFAMIETVTALFGLISASIFLAHALDGYRSRS